jgi:TatD DNase family protein
MFADSHTHLEFPDFDADREQVLDRALESGVRYMMAIGSGTGPHRLRAGIEMAEGRDWVSPTIGIHPHEARLATPEHFAELDQLVRDPRVAAIGEIGLDYHYDHSPREMQREVFLRQIELAGRNGLPLVIHCREAWPDCLEILEQHWKSSGLGGILHCFSGTFEDARRGMDCGFYVSFAGNLTFPKAAPLREVAAKIPHDRLLIETDCPFLAPVPRRGKRNEPSFVPYVAQQLADIQGLSIDEVGHYTTNNFLRFLEIGRGRGSVARADP